MGKKPSLKISSAFKILLCFITFVSILYFILIEKDLMKALFLLNIIANYRIMLAFMTDWNEEVIFRENSLKYETHGISSNRKMEEDEGCDISEMHNTNNINNINNISKFSTISDIDNNKYDYLNSVYEDKINYNYNAYDTNFAWWSDY
jgi:hypothetical protein